MGLVAVISDIHACADDLSAVLSQIDQANCQEVWCLGDFASGGPEPEEAFEMVVAHCSVVLGGNHEMMVAGKLFETSNAEWAEWARQAHEKLGPERVSALMALPSVVDGPELQMTHASLRDPLWEFINRMDIAEAQFDLMERDYLLYGHTHRAELWTSGGRETIKRGQWLDLPQKALLNPGAVHRDRSWMALDMEGDRPRRAAWHSA